jgi:hypothetical protein
MWGDEQLGAPLFGIRHGRDGGFVGSPFGPVPKEYDRPHDFNNSTKIRP